MDRRTFASWAQIDCFECFDGIIQNDDDYSVLNLSGYVSKQIEAFRDPKIQGSSQTISSYELKFAPIMKSGINKKSKNFSS